MAYVLYILFYANSTPSPLLPHNRIHDFFPQFFGFARSLSLSSLSTFFSSFFEPIVGHLSAEERERENKRKCFKGQQLTEKNFFFIIVNKAFSFLPVLTYSCEFVQWQRARSTCVAACHSRLCWRFDQKWKTNSHSRDCDASHSDSHDKTINKPFKCLIFIFITFCHPRAPPACNPFPPPSQVRVMM